MKRISIILLFVHLLLSNCTGQNKYFQPTGIKDRTLELSKHGDWIKLNDRESVDGYTLIGDSIFGGEIACNVRPLKGIDTKTFRILAGTKYARDMRKVYYPIGQTCIDYTDCGVCFFSEFIIEKAKTSTFRYLANEYATDGSNVYFRGVLLEGADGATFKVIDGPEFFFFAIDKQRVYRHDQIFNDADPSTFHLVEDSGKDLSKVGSKYIIADKNKIWEYTPPNQIKEIPKR